MIKIMIPQWEDVLHHSIQLTYKYLSDYPQAWTKKIKKKPAPITFDKITLDITKMFDIEPKIKEPTTVPDELVAELLEILCGNEKSMRKLFQKQYNNQKQVEQVIIGTFLEFYILKNSSQYGWAQTGNCLSGIDMIKKNNDDSWYRLQIKNSDNTPNSSSAGFIKDKGNIVTWKRRRSSKGDYFWDEFPDENVRKHLSEDGFREFIKDYYK
jgi:hypothetical protein